MRITNVEPVVKRALELKPDTRADDFLLLVEVYKAFYPGIETTNFGYIMKNHNELGLPPFESVRRCRQRLQAANEELKPSAEAQRKRLEKISEYIDYNRYGT